MSKKKLNGNEINKISAGVKAKDVGYGTLGTVALAGGVAMLGHVVKDGIRKDSLDGWGKGWTIFHTSAATIAGVCMLGSAFAFGKIGKDKNDSNSKN